MNLTFRAAIAVLAVILFAAAVSVAPFSPWKKDSGLLPDTTPEYERKDLFALSKELPPPPPPPSAPLVETEEPDEQPPEEKPKDEPSPPAPPKKATTTTPAPAPQIVQPLPHTEEPVNFATINTNTRAALVNIYCSTKAGGAIRPFSGTGIIIDPRGVVVTNAHIAQYFLLQDYPVPESVSCTLRTGSPARETYRAELLYIPPTWIHAHAQDIVDPNPTGTGENDYAFLYISEKINAPRPDVFPYIPYDVSDALLEENQPVLVAGYPAEFIGSIASLRDLYITSTVSAVKKVYTFTSELPDLISVGGNVVAQKGASGGAVVGKNEKLIGVVATATEESATDQRDLRAVTLAHINRSMISHTGRTMPDYLARNLNSAGAVFRASEGPELTKKLTDAIEAAMREK